MPTDSLNTFSDIPRIHTAIAEWAACMIFVILLRRRVNSKAAAIGLCASFLAGFCGLQLLAGILPLYLWVPGIIAAVALIYAFIFVMCKMRASETFFWMARAFIMAEFAASAEWQFFAFFTEGSRFASSILAQYIFMTVAYALIFTAAFLLERRYSSRKIHYSLHRRDIYNAVGIALIIFVASNISYLTPNTPISGRYEKEIFYIRTLVDLCGLILFFTQQEQRLWSHTKSELEAMQKLFSFQYEQYCLSKNNIDFLGRRYHDLKHQIAIIKGEVNPDKRAEYVDEMEKAIRCYESVTNTGNKVLDIIITSKQMICIENNINFTCVADGRLLDFMEAMDICSIMGNALDNSIESVSKLDDIEKRLIKMAVYSQDDLIMIRFENYIENELRFEDGLPVTTKNSRETHGYGLRSIRHAVENYNGTLSLDTSGNWFSLCLLIPKNQN